MFTKKIGWLLLLVVSLLSLPAFGAATDEVVPGTCSVATLKGTYGDLEQGTVVAQLPGLPPPPFPAAESALVTFDGAGNLSATFTVSFDGMSMPGTATGTYVVKPDCKYSDSITPSGGAPGHHAGTITGKGLLREVNYIFTDPYIVGWGTLKETPARGCSPATLRGMYGLFGQGTITAQMPGFPPPPLPVAHSGSFTADGAGTLSGKDTINMDGVAIPDTFTATDTINPDCTVSSIITTSLGVLHESGTITGEGMFQEVNKIVTDAGWVFVETARKQ
jgi:hypothetical protein